MIKCRHEHVQCCNLGLNENEWNPAAAGVVSELPVWQLLSGLWNNVT